MHELSLPCRIFGDNGQTFLNMGLAWSGNNPFTDMDHEYPARYITIIQVKDYIRLSRAAAGVDILSVLDEKTLDDLRQHRVLLVLDLCNEGPSFSKAIFDELHANLGALQIARQSVVFVNQNRLMGSDYSRAYGPDGIKFAYFDYFVKLLLMRLSGSDMFGEASRTEVESYSPGFDDDAKILLSMNATPRWHRIIIYRWLCKNGFADKSLLSFHGANIFNPKGSSVDFSSMPPQVPLAFASYISGLETWMPKEPVRFDTDIRKGNELADSLETWAYRKTYCSLVTESDFFERTERLTEKAIKAAGLGHPFILVGAPRSLSALSELGFEVFSNVIDPSYDRDEDPVSRMNTIFDLVLRLQNDLAEDRHRWIAATREQSHANHLNGKGPAQERFRKLVETPIIHRMRRFIETGEF